MNTIETIGKIDEKEKYRRCYLVRIIQTFDPENEYVKIGSSVNCKTRLKDLQVASYFKLEIIKRIGGGFQTEGFLQQKYKQYRGPGGREWFKFPLDLYKDVLSVYDDMLTKYPVYDPIKIKILRNIGGGLLVGRLDKSDGGVVRLDFDRQLF